MGSPGGYSAIAWIGPAKAALNTLFPLFLPDMGNGHNHQYLAYPKGGGAPCRMRPQGRCSCIKQAKQPLSWLLAPGFLT